MDMVRTPNIQCDKSAGSKIVPATRRYARVGAPKNDFRVLAVPENHLRGAGRAFDLVLRGITESVGEMFQDRNVIAAGDTLALFPLRGSGPLAPRAPESRDVIVRVTHGAPPSMAQFKRPTSRM
jgi:hypothetical protein